ncbi:MAG TPA: flagellar biosynthesis protein FlhA [Steroidobacteraceae bacterium]|jgi:type III secretion protein V
MMRRAFVKTGGNVLKELIISWGRGARALRGPRSVSDILLAGGVVAIVALMILPIPVLVVDVLVAANILFGVGLLLLAIYIPGPTAFASFPSVLLLTTLFRLSLSIAITRLILLDADAGHIIETFGQVVVGGNLVVGIVVFLIITVVQFIVIAKGAERVAEVAARFTLDAMPGKQLSIDSDLRSGLIDKDEARRRRRRLEVESQLHGALDGAMKFVRGDSIAGIVIIIINILGGLAIGVLQLGLPLADAVRTYSILTIGDGLVAQIPALLSAIAAGLIVTRTAGEVQDQHLGASIARELSGHPRVMLTGGVLALLLAAVPGFPWPVFVAFGLPMVAVALWQRRNESAALHGLLSRLGLASSARPALEAPYVEPDLKPLPAVVLEVGSDVIEAYGRERLSGAALRVAERLREEYGAPIANPVLRIAADLQSGRYRLKTFGVCIADSDLGTVELLEQSLALALRRQLAQFAGIQETSNLLNRWSRDYPDLIKEMLRAAAPQRVSEVLRRLLDEGVPIRQLRDIFEAITEVSARERDIVPIVEQVRVALRRHITQRHLGPDRAISALIAHPELEDALRQLLRGSPQSGQLAIDPQLLQRIGGEIRAARASAGAGFDRTVMLCSMDVRRHLRKLIEGEFFELPVLSFQELSGDVPIVPLGQVRG